MRQGRLAAAALSAAALLAPLPAAAASHEGVVRQLRVDSEADAPLCALTSPAMPGGDWACVYPNRRHYQEMREMLFRALDARHVCVFEWSVRDAISRRAQIVSLACSAR